MATDANVNVVSRLVFGSGHFDRLDAEFVEAEVFAREIAVAHSGGKRLRDLVSPVGTAVTAQHAEASAEIDYISIDSVDADDGLIFAERLHFGARPSRAKYVVQPWDILVSNVRPNRGAVALIAPRNSGALATSGMTMIRDPADISPAMLFAYFRSRQLREQLVRRARGSMYPAVLERDVMDVLVPPFPPSLADETEGLVAEAIAKQDSFIAQLAQMEEMLGTFLAPYGAPPSPLHSGKVGVDATVIAWSSAYGAGGAGRIDAEFFRSEYADFFSVVTALGPSFPLERHYTLRTGSLRPGDDRVATVKQAVLTNAGVNWSAVEWRSGRCGTPQVLAGDILLAATAHEIAYVGKKVDFVTEVPDDVAACNQAVAEIIVLHPRADSTMSGAYVAAFLRSPSGLHQVQRCIRGLRGGHTYPQDLAREVVVPDPDRVWLDEFDAIAHSADQLRRAAKVTMRRAVAQVETYLDSSLLSSR